MGNEKIEISTLKLVVAALVIVFGGNAGSIYSNTNPDKYRPDPFTGLDGAKMQAAMLYLINENNAKHNEIHNALKLEFNQMKYILADCQKHHKGKY